MLVSPLLSPSELHATSAAACSYTPTQTAIDPLLTVREAAALFAVSVPTFWRRVADGTIPKPLKLGRTSRWVRSELLAVIEALKAQRAP